MKKKRIVPFIFLLIISLFLWPGLSSAFSRADSLRALEGIEILVEEFKPEVEDFISALQVQSELEAKLRPAGIRILDKEENEKLQPLRRPYLYIKITSYRPPSRRDVLAFNVEIALKQQVLLRGLPEDSEQSLFSPTWYKNSVGVASAKNPAEIKNAVNDLTEKFIKAYSTAKGKK
jgi:hypothetical protein